jgi:hypothetical protein
MTLRIACPYRAAARALTDAARGRVVPRPRCQKPCRTAPPASAVTASSGAAPL